MTTNIEQFIEQLEKIINFEELKKIIDQKVVEEYDNILLSDEIFYDVTNIKHLYPALMSALSATENGYNCIKYSLNESVEKSKTINVTKMKFKGTIIITDPCYIINHYGTNNYDDWEKCKYGSNMEALGINTYLTHDTLYGDWSCTTYNKNTNEVIGEFCADAGLVSVFLLEEVLKYNPDFDYHINRPWTTTIIKDFDGEVEIKIVEQKYYSDFYNRNVKDEVVMVVGTGNINFYTKQTGL